MNSHPIQLEVPIPDTDDELFVEADHVFQVENITI